MSSSNRLSSSLTVRYFWIESRHRHEQRERQRARGAMSQKKEVDPAILSATGTYRREVCILASESRSQDDLVMSLHRQLGRNALCDTSTSFESLPSSFLHCHACGCWLQVGRNGTALRLRSVGRGNTRRRRASRRKVGRRTPTHGCFFK